MKADVTTARTGRGEGPLSAPYRAVTVGTVLVVTLLAFEAMAVGTVLPVTANELDGLALYAWSFNAYLLAALLANVVAGTWCDRSGPRWPMLAGLGVFVTGLLISGVAASMEVFVAGRAVQGLGGGAAIVALYVLAARVYPERLLPRLFAALATAWVVPSLVGPAVGGFVAERFDWRWVFLGLIPLVLPAVAMLLPALSADTGGEPESVAGAAGRRLIAALALAAGIGALLYAIDDLRPAVVPVVLLGAAAMMYGLPRLLPAGALRLRRGLPAAVSMRGLMAGAFLAAEAFIPLVLTTVHGFSPTEAGLMLTVGALGWTAGSWVQGRSQRPRATLVIAGAVSLLIGTAGVAVTLQFTGWPAAIPWILAGAGMGLGSSLSVLVLDSSPRAEQGVNSAALQISDTVGSSVGIGLAGALVTAIGIERLAAGAGAAGALTVAIAVAALFTSLRVADGGSPGLRTG